MLMKDTHLELSLAMRVRVGAFGEVLVHSERRSVHSRRNRREGKNHSCEVMGLSYERTFEVYSGEYGVRASKAVCIYTAKRTVLFQNQISLLTSMHQAAG